MGRSLLIGRIAGIRILIHWTFLLLLGFIVFSEMRKGSDTVAIVATIGFVLALFACVVLHELGHSLTARRFGIETKKITLLPIGGVASLERIPEDPKQELWVALAGPAVNVVIALLLYPFVASFSDESLSGEGVGNVATTQGFFSALFRVNVALVLFNAIPAFPMDGGRVLRALLALRLGRIRATSIAAGLGQLIAVGFVFFGLFNNPFLILIGIFVYFGAQTENVVVQHLELLKDYTVRNAMMTNFVTLAPTDTVKDAADKLLSGSDQDLIVVDNDQAIGVMTRPLIMDSLRQNRLDTSVVDVMERDFDTVQIGDRLTEVYSNAQRKPNAFYPVLENHRLRGVIDMNNINEFVTIRAALRY
ncbi:MAG: site-2 protease family protein [Ferruginibacter sp.]|nr:site-2 protease family protein [Cytophagales bacterium]